MIKDGWGCTRGKMGWTIFNGSVKEGRAMMANIELMLRAFNAEADTLVAHGSSLTRSMGALERLKKVADTIARLGKTMNIRISAPYYQLRVRELELNLHIFCRNRSEQK